MGYVMAKTEEIMTLKEQEHAVPVCATLHEIIKDVREDVTECMRELHRQGFYRASRTINLPMLMKAEAQDSAKP